MIVHAKHASNTYGNVIIKSADTDVYVIAVNANLNIHANLFFETGVCNMKIIISQYWRPMVLVINRPTCIDRYLHITDKQLHRRWWLS